MYIRDAAGTEILRIFGSDSNAANHNSGNLFIGYEAGKSNATVNVEDQAGNDNTAVGYRTLTLNVVGLENTAVGFRALENNTSDSNSAFGNQALTANTTGFNNSAFGSFALDANTTGDENAVFGASALGNNLTGSFNSAFGTAALLNNVSATNSVAIGYRAGRGVASYNNQGGTYVGYQSGHNAGTGSDYNTFLGYQAGYDVTTGAYNINIGQNVTSVSNTDSGQLNIGNVLYGSGLYSGGTVTSTPTSNAKLGIGTSTLRALLSLDRGVTTTPGIGGIRFDMISQSTVEGGVTYGDNAYIKNQPTATSTLVGKIIRIEDSTALGNTIRGLEVQTERGSNTKGENTALSGFARTFGVRGTTEGDAGALFEPAGGFFETQGTTQGNAIRGYSSSITTAALMKLFQDTSDFTGTGLLMNFGNAGGSFAATSSANFFDLQVGGTTKFKIAANGSTTIGDGSTKAALVIPLGSICVDNDGSCVSTTTGQIRSVTQVLGNSDLAEMYFSSQPLETGEIVALRDGLSVERANPENAVDVVGVVSTKPGQTLGSDDTSLVPGEKGYPIGLKGRVPVRLSTENGPIRQGDRITLSSIPGVGMKATESSRIIGIAMEDFDGVRAYSEGYLNQFGDDMIKEEVVLQRVIDPKAQDSCWQGGGSALGETEECEPQPEEEGEFIIEETTLENTEYEAMYDELERKSAETMVDANGETVQVGQVTMFIELGWYQIAEESKILAELASTTLLSQDDGETLWDRIKALAQNFVDGVLAVTGIRADRIETKELCVDGVCVTADDLRALLEGVNASASTTGDTDSIDSGTTDDGTNPDTGGETDGAGVPTDTASSTDTGTSTETGTNTGATTTDETNTGINDGSTTEGTTGETENTTENSQEGTQTEAPEPTETPTTPETTPEEGSTEEEGVPEETTTEESPEPEPGPTPSIAPDVGPTE